MPTLKLASASTEDDRARAERRLPRYLFDYIDGGAVAERTLRANEADLQALALRQRVMRDVSALDTRTHVLGEDWVMPLALAPIGMGGMMARRAEAGAVAAAQAAGVPFCLSTVGICSLEEVARAATRPFWFQLYMLKDRGIVRQMLERARGVGVDTLVFTVDLAVLGARRRDVRNGLSGGAGAWARLRGSLIETLLHPGWLVDVGLRGKPHTFGNLSAFVPDAGTPADFAAWIHGQIDASVTWADIAALRKDWPGRLVIKGVLDPEDARAAVDAGADGVIVSNHGGRQLDGVASGIAALPGVVEAVGTRTAVLMDGGVRSGQDVLRAVALGAKGVLVGRPWVFAMAAGGPQRLRQWLATLQEELKVAMALTGVRAVAEIGPDCLDLSRR